MFTLDASITYWINALGGHWPLLDALLAFASAYGVPLIVAAVALQWWPRDERTRIRHAVTSSGLAFLVGLLLNQVILLAVHRVRPYDQSVTHLLIPPSADWSFPSDHATASVAVAATFLLLGLRRRGLGFLFAALIISFSRVYLGIHFISDVLGGAVTGLLAAFALMAVYSPQSRLSRLITGIL